MLVWWFEPNPRFLFCLLPLLMAGLWMELSRLGNLIADSLRKPALGERMVALMFVVVLMAVGAMFVNQVRFQNSLSGSVALARQREMLARTSAAYQWIARNTPPEAVFLSINDPLVYLYTGRHAFRRAQLNDILAGDGAGRLRPTEKLQRFVKDYGATHVLFTGNDFETSDGKGPALNLDGTSWKPVYQDGWSTVCSVSAHQ
jgi:hypothetical protein